MEYYGKFSAVFSATLFCFFLLAPGKAGAFLGLFDKHEKIQERDGELAINVENLGPGAIKYYRFEKNGKYVKIFLVRDSAGNARAALDACEVCFREEKGYEPTKGGGSVTCVNCGQKFPLARIGLLRGGCNPHPVDCRIEGDTITIKADALIDDGARFFPGNKK